MKDNNITKLELVVNDTKVSWEVPYSDVTVEELFTAFVGLMITQTFSKEGIINHVKNYIEEYEN
jgi:hypothetical protein